VDSLQKSLWSKVLLPVSYLFTLLIYLLILTTSVRVARGLEKKLEPKKLNRNSHSYHITRITTTTTTTTTTTYHRFTANMHDNVH